MQPISFKATQSVLVFEIQLFSNILAKLHSHFPRKDVIETSNTFDSYSLNLDAFYSNFA